MNSWRILVADDEPLVLRVMRDILLTLPADVVEAQDGEQALRLAKAERPDLILLDVMMPRLDGFQVAEALKQDPATAEIPLMFISALRASRDKVRGLELGAEDYLSKPIDPEELKARVRMILRRVKPAARESPMASGHLQVMNLPSLVQLLESERRTARLVMTRGNERGEIIFSEGRISQASQGPRQGAPAVYQLLAWQEGAFQLAPHDSGAPVGGQVSGPNQKLLMEGLRRLDELPALRAGLPGPKVPLEVSAALRAAVQAQGPPEIITLVGLADGARDLDQILALSPLDTWATLKVLQRLVGVGGLEWADVGAERRGGPRLNVEVPIEYQSLRAFQKTGTFNLSARGVFIRTAVPFEVGEQILLRFNLPGQPSSIKVVGHVVWRNADASKRGGMGMGIQFGDLTTGDREVIERHLAQVIAAQISGGAEAL
jgi:uncharacterized protein (TIGR02266 family)